MVWQPLVNKLKCIRFLVRVKLVFRLFTTLEQGQTSQKWTPFWELFEDQFCTKYEKMRKQRMPKNRCRKKVTLRKNGCLSPDPEAP